MVTPESRPSTQSSTANYLQFNAKSFTNALYYKIVVYIGMILAKREEDTVIGSLMSLNTASLRPIPWFGRTWDTVHKNGRPRGHIARLMIV